MNYDRCDCDCHDNDHISHIMACCYPCGFCRANIRAWGYTKHEEACKEKYDALLKEFEANRPLQSLEDESKGDA